MQPKSGVPQRPWRPWLRPAECFCCSAHTGRSIPMVRQAGSSSTNIAGGKSVVHVLMERNPPGCHVCDRRHLLSVHGGVGPSSLDLGGPVTLGWRGWIASGAAVLIGVWQFTAFPGNGNIAEREVWARLHIPKYTDLTNTIENIPVIQDSIGHITAIAPASGVQHVTELDMDGVAMKLLLDVVGERGIGALSVNCTIDRDVVFDWQPAIWIASGKTIEIATVPNLLQRKPRRAAGLLGTTRTSLEVIRRLTIEAYRLIAKLAELLATF